MTPQAATRFKLRGLTGVLLIAAGIALALTFRKSSVWPADTKTLAIALAYGAAIGGAGLFSSYVHQLEFKQMKSSLMGLAVLLFTMLILNL